MRTRAERRNAQAKAKAKTKQFMKTILGRTDDTEARIGRTDIDASQTM
jgi:hypothetical protein